jgi:hypothetical protein
MGLVLTSTIEEAEAPVAASHAPAPMPSKLIAWSATEVEVVEDAFGFATEDLRSETSTWESDAVSTDLAEEVL